VREMGAERSPRMPNLHGRKDIRGHRQNGL